MSADTGRLACRNMQVTGALLNNGLQQLVDLNRRHSNNLANRAANIIGSPALRTGFRSRNYVKALRLAAGRYGNLSDQILLAKLFKPVDFRERCNSLQCLVFCILNYRFHSEETGLASNILRRLTAEGHLAQRRIHGHQLENGESTTKTRM